MEATLTNKSNPGKMAKAELILPGIALSGCIFAAFIRDTRECGLNDAQKFNYFAASPLCAISWCFAGSGHIINNPEQFGNPQIAPLMPSIVFSGPQQRPSASWNNGDIYALTICFYPEAFSALTGIDMHKYINRVVPIDGLFEGDFLALVKSAFCDEDARSFFSRFEDQLKPEWQGVHQHDNFTSNRISDWCRSLATRAAIGGIGRSVRQIERRIKNWTGQSQRDLGRYSRSEEVFLEALIASKEGDLDLAQVSGRAGFADQSHMGRQVKIDTGFSPKKLMRLIENDEAFWSYRLFGTMLL